MKRSKILFCGTPEFAIPSLRALHREFSVPLVLSQPDKPRNRGKITPTPVKAEAVRLGIDVITPENVNDPDVLRQLREHGFDFIVEVAYGKLLSSDFLNLVPDRVLNVHPSLLPLYRGAAPLVWPILNGDEKTGISIMLVDEGMDTGDILDQTVVDIGEKNAVELHDELAARGAVDLVRVLKEYDFHYQNRVRQTGTHTYAKKITKEMGRLGFTEGAQSILRKIRALNPWPGTYIILNGKRIQVLEAVTVAKKGAKTAGIVYRADDSGIYIDSIDDSIRITRVKPSGKKEMGADAFLRGNPVPVGTRIE